MYFTALDKFLSGSSRKANSELSSNENQCTTLHHACASASMKYAQHLNMFQLSKGTIVAHVRQTYPTVFRFSITFVDL